jgi:hypothetical protein
LIVQRIFNDFAVEVHETYANIALVEGDLNEYNQSQQQTRSMPCSQSNDWYLFFKPKDAISFQITLCSEECRVESGEAKSRCRRKKVTLRRNKYLEIKTTMLLLLGRVAQSNCQDYWK